MDVHELPYIYNRHGWEKRRTNDLSMTWVDKRPMTKWDDCSDFRPASCSSRVRPGNTVSKLSPNSIRGDEAHLRLALVVYEHSLATAKSPLKIEIAFFGVRVNILTALM